MSLIGNTVEQKIWNYLLNKIKNDIGVASLMGNLFAESGLNPKNMQDSYERALGFNDETYTAAVDNGSYSNFINDEVGYGLPQWTYWTRKKNLYDYAKSKNKSIGDLEIQLDYLWKELEESYPSVVSALKNATTILQASNVVLMKFENPLNQGEAVQNKRASYGQNYYGKYANNNNNEEGEINMGYTNSSLATYKKISPNKTKNRNHNIDMIIIHCTAGQTTIESLGNMFAKSSTAAASNYGIGKDGKIGMFVEEKDRAWCSGGYDSDGNIIRVNGISGADIDHRAISIEVSSDSTHPYAVNDKAIASLIELCVDICKRNNIKKLLWQGNKSLVGQVGKQNMAVHRWFAQKECPGDYLYNKHPYIVEQVNKKLGVSSGSNSSAATKPTVSATTSTSTSLKFKAGDVVNFIGGKHYGSTNSTTGSSVKASKAKVTAVSKTGKHPYHIRAVDDNGNFISGVYGWVDSSCVSALKNNSFKSYRVKVVADELNIRKGAGTNFGKVGVIDDGGVYTIVAESSGQGASKWGLLKAYEKNRNGWVSLDYCEKI